ncbi:MAG: hypothetical protein HN976_31820 [Lentisphaerae bacterium]|jgi:hypothetical protein|nr:hypothetical protein [Lentisphaerota bacterium]MBT7059728.1 hypothetical protein [Lentisphaerota bacterium]
MKLTAEKSDDQYTCVVPDLGVLSFQKLPSWNYQWSGYADMYEGEADFTRFNFGSGRISDEVCYLCSVENGIALLEYIDRYVLECERFAELEQCLIEEMDYWFFLAWESAMTDYNDLPDWCHSIVELYIQKGYIFRACIETDQYEEEFFIFKKDDLKRCTQDIEEILRVALVECREEKAD